MSELTTLTAVAQALSRPAKLADALRRAVQAGLVAL